MSWTLKFIEFLILDIVDSITLFAAAVASFGGCDVELVRTEVVRRRYHRTMGSVLLKCPVATVKRVMAECRILIDWVLARVGTFVSLHMQCYRCMEYAHVRHKWSSGVNSSKRCYVR